MTKNCWEGQGAEQREGRWGCWCLYSSSDAGISGISRQQSLPMEEQEVCRLILVAIISPFSCFSTRKSIPPTSAVVQAAVPRAEQRLCAAAGQGLCPAEGKLCSCQDAVSSGRAGEMDGASAAVLVLDTEQSLARKKEIQTNLNCSVVLEVFYRNRDVF